MQTATAHSKAIIVGEHAVVPPFRKMGIAAAAGPGSTTVTVRKYSENRVRVVSNDPRYGSAEKTETEMDAIVGEYEALRKQQRGYNLVKEKSKQNPLDPTFVVISEIKRRHGWKPLEIQIESSVPKNLGSSASVFVATAAAVLAEYEISASAKEIGDIANAGDMIAHGRASGIDAHTIAAGGWNGYRAGEGTKPLQIDFPVRMLAVDSGKPARTMDTVDYLQELKELENAAVFGLMDGLGDTVDGALSALRQRDLRGLGQAMTDYYRRLRRIDQIDGGIPRVVFLPPEVETVVEGALRVDGVLGAKPTGGWGGGCVLVLAESEDTVKEVKRKFPVVHDLQLGVAGVRVL